MSHVKAYNPEIAKEIGIHASLVLRHLKWWMDEYGVSKVFRTNKQLSEDFKGTLSESQIQRAKKKLVDGGYVIVSFDKGHDRVTHFTFTEKTLKAFGMVVEAVQKVGKKIKEAIKPKAKPPVEKPKQGTTKSMESEFHNAGNVNHAVGMPDFVKEKLSGLFKKKDIDKVPEPIFFDEDESEQDFDDHFAALDAGFAMCQEHDKNLSLNEIMTQAFNRVPNIEQFEKNRATLESARNFKEDY